MRRYIVPLALTCLPILVHAADAPPTYGDWALGAADDKSSVWASTTNDSGEAFGEWCTFGTKSCMWMLGLHTPCQKGATASVLANAESGATALDILCAGQIGNGMYAYSFKDWKALEASIKDTAKVGFAFPLVAGDFLVVRFSLNGRTDSTQALETYFFKQAQTPPADQPASDQGTADQRL